MGSPLSPKVPLGDTKAPEFGIGVWAHWDALGCAGMQCFGRRGCNALVVLGAVEGIVFVALGGTGLHALGALEGTGLQFSGLTGLHWDVLGCSALHSLVHTGGHWLPLGSAWRQRGARRR